MQGAPRPALRPPEDLPGVRALREAPPPRPGGGARLALAVFCTFAAPPALLGAGVWLHVIQAKTAPVALWLAACGSFFAGLVLSLRLDPLPPRRILDVRMRRRGPRADNPQEIPMQPLFADALETPLPGIRPGMSPAAILEQLAKLREQGDLSHGEWERARRTLVTD